MFSLALARFLSALARRWDAKIALTYATRFLAPSFEDNPLPIFQTVNRIPESLRDTVRIAAGDLGVARIARRSGVAQQVGNVILMYVRRPEPCGESVP